MASTPEYTRKAVDNYRKKFDVMQLRLPKGTKEIIDNKVGKTNAHNFVVECVLNALETSQETQEEPTDVQAEEVPQEQPKKPQTAHREPTLEELQELQELINQKKAEQGRNGKQIPEDEEKEKLRRESLIKANMDY